MTGEGLRSLMVAIAVGDEDRVRRALSEVPELSVAAIEREAPRTDPAPPVLQQFSCYFYRGDTVLHVAAATHRPAIASLLLDLGAKVGARNRRGTTPLHHAAAGSVGSPQYDPVAQVETMGVLLGAGADAEAANRDGATPLHRAVRTRCSRAVATLLEAGASPVRVNGHGSSPMDLATHATGRGGSGTPEAKREQVEIIRMLTVAVSR